MSENTQTNIYFSNIPRRKIYEHMQDFEEGLMELEILQYNQENFDKFKDKYNQETLQNLKKTFENLKSLYVMFFENKKFKTEQDFETDLQSHLDNQKHVISFLKRNKNLTIKKKYLILKLTYLFKKYDQINDLKQAKMLYKNFIKFNDLIPQFLELRRDKLK